MNNRYLQFLDDLTEKELTVFFYHIILKLPQKEVAKRRKLSIKSIEAITKQIKRDMEFLPIKEKIFEAFEVK